MSGKTILTLLIVLVPVIGLVVAASFGFGGFGGYFERFPNPHFVIAFALGATATVLLSVGLFALGFYSARRGHDDQVGLDQADREQGPDEP